MTQTPKAVKCKSCKSLSYLSLPPPTLSTQTLPPLKFTINPKLIVTKQKEKPTAVSPVDYRKGVEGWGRGGGVGWGGGGGVSNSYPPRGRKGEGTSLNMFISPSRLLTLGKESNSFGKSGQLLSWQLYADLSACPLLPAYSVLTSFTLQS